MPAPHPLQNQGPVRSRTMDPAFSRTLLLATDLQQSILAELDCSGPNRLAYSPYGVQSSLRAPGTHLGFNGQLRERPTGWYYLGNGYRVYNPVLMRFHSPDRLSPFGRGGANAYAYCTGDPVNFEDPTGQYGEIIARLVQLTATTALHAGIVTTNLVGATARGWLLHAARMSTVASSTAIVGTVGQLAGLPGAVYISNVATTVSAAATMVRYVPAIVNGLRARTLWATVRGNVRNLVRGTAFPKSAEVPSTSLPGGAAPASIEIPMTSQTHVPAPAQRQDDFAQSGSVIRGSLKREN
jgi:RHS repeat-associated protein